MGPRLRTPVRGFVPRVLGFRASGPDPGPAPPASASCLEPSAPCLRPEFNAFGPAVPFLRTRSAVPQLPRLWFRLWFRASVARPPAAWPPCPSSVAHSPTPVAQSPAPWPPLPTRGPVPGPVGSGSTPRYASGPAARSHRPQSMEAGTITGLGKTSRPSVPGHQSRSRVQ
jgi:hypothetical protein